MDTTKLTQTLNDLSLAITELVESNSHDPATTNSQFLEIKTSKGSSATGKGILWTGDGVTKQIVYNSKPARFFSSESFDLNRDREYMIGGTSVLSSTQLGTSITRSNLQEVGTLKGLIVNGNVRINQYLYYNAHLDRLGLGTDTPNAGLSVAEHGVEVMVGTNDQLHGMIGTFPSTDLDIVTGNTTRISVKANGDIEIGSKNQKPVQMKIHGQVSVGVATPDPQVDLHVAGPVRLNNRLQLSSNAPPVAGTFGIGDIVWNSEPAVGQPVGWVCVRAGSPGVWNPFGEIKERNR